MRTESGRGQTWIEVYSSNWNYTNTSIICIDAKFTTNDERYYNESTLTSHPT